jgi:hypothetical protein
MKEYEFTVVLDVPELTDDLAEQLCVAGCTDGLACVSCGVVKVIFGREADSLESAIRSAIADVHAAGCTAARVEIERDSELLRV